MGEFGVSLADWINPESREDTAVSMQKETLSGLAEELMDVQYRNQ